MIRSYKKREVKYYEKKAGFHVEQEGEFIIRDYFKEPIEIVKGRIISLMKGEGSLYAMILTESGIRPGRLT